MNIPGRVVCVSGGENHSLAVTEDGKVYAWGYNGWGQLGNGTIGDVATPQPQFVNIPGRVAGVSGGYLHSLALTENGKVYAWGGNYAGQLGSGPGGYLVTPQLVNIPGYVVGVSGGEMHSLAVLGAPISITVNDAAGVIGLPTTLSAVLRRSINNVPLKGRSLHFFVNNITVGSAVTDSTGTATLMYNVPAFPFPGPQTITVVRLADGTYDSLTDYGTLTVSPADSSVMVANISGTIGQVVTLSAVLRRTTDNAVLPGLNLSFYVNNAYVGTTTTDSAGTATVSYTIPSSLNPGTQLTIKAVRLSNNQYNGSTGYGTLAVAPADTSVTVAAVSGQAGQTVTLSAVLTRLDTNAVMKGYSLSFYVNNAYVGTPATDTTGTATVNYTIPANLSAGTQLTIKVVRLANSVFNASQGSGNLTVTP